MQSIKKNILLNCIRMGVTILFPFIVFQYASRIILAENLGKVDFSNSIVNYFILFAGLGISSYAIRESGKFRNSKVQFEEFASEVFSINIVSTVLSYMLLFVAVLLSKKLQDYSLLIFIECTSIVFTTFGVDWINIIHEDYRYIIIRTMFFQSLTLLLTILFVRNIKDYYIFAIIIILGKICPELLNFFYIRKKYCHVSFTFNKKLFQHLKPIMVIFFTSLVISIYVNFDTTMIGIFKDDTQVGYYSVAVKIYSAMKTIFSAIISVTISRISLYFASDDKDALKELVQNMVNYFTMTILPLIIMVIVLAPNIINILFGEIYAASVLPLQILCVGIIFAVYASTITNSIFLPLGMEKYSLIATTASAVSNFLLNFFFIKKFGISGAAITTAIAEFVVFCIAYFFLRRRKFYFFGLLKMKNIVKALCICVAILIINLVISLISKNVYINSAIQVILIGVVFIISFKEQLISEVYKIKKGSM